MVIMTRTSLRDLFPETEVIKIENYFANKEACISHF